MYADDILLIAGSVSVLQSMMDLCSEKISYLYMRFNVERLLQFVSEKCVNISSVFR